MSQIAKSAALPASSVPRLSAMPSAWAALRVTPASASSGVMRNRVHAMLSINKSELTGDEPGFESVAMAIGTPAARNASIGGSLVSRRK